MDMYHDKLSDKDTTICSSNHLPSEALRLHTSPRRRFRACNGEYNTHVWYITCVRLVLLKSKDMKTFRGVVELDPADNAIVTGLTKLMTCDEDSDLTDTEKYAGFGRLISHIIYIVTFTWKEFFHEAEANVEFIVSFFPTLCSRQAYKTRVEDAFKRKPFHRRNSSNILANSMSCLLSGSRSDDA